MEERVAAGRERRRALVLGIKARKGFRRILTPALSRQEREYRPPV